MVEDSDRLPLTRSLEADVRSAFATEARSNYLSRESLMTTLANLTSGEATLVDALVSAGSPPASAEDEALLLWVDAVFQSWTQRYPLSPELQTVVSLSRPLAAAFALRDERFFVPGGHALHRLLDVIHNGMAGWYSGLGSAAANALEGAREAIERSCRNFPSEPAVDETLSLLSQKIQAHEGQLARLDAPLLDRERATLGPDAVRMETAITLNALLVSHQVPGSVARFIKSDWFDSGVLIGEQSGIGSAEWKTFIDTTQLLIDAVQPINNGDPDNQSRLQNTMHQLPATLSRQLLSLQPDNDAVAGAIGLIEYALLRNMRGEDLGLLQADPISARGIPPGGIPSEAQMTAAGIVPGRWYAVDGPDGEQRVRLAGGLVHNLYLLFMDFLGARAFRKTFADFQALLTSGEARQLPVTDSFCRAMVEATEQQVTRVSEREAQETEARAQAAEQARQQEAEIAATLTGQQDPPAASHWTTEESPSSPQVPETHHSGGAGLAEAGSAAVPTRAEPDPGAVPAADRPFESHTVVKLQIPMGTWMGFHDRDPPLMARVAVRDLEKDSYIFTNREGIKLRELTVAQLIALIDRDMVDILERKGNFREAVNQMRNDPDRLSAQ